MDESPKEKNPQKRKKRKRIDFSAKMIGSEKVTDDLAYVKNKSTERARRSKEVTYTIKASIWHDHHYSIRSQHGDDNGPRNGIEPETVNDLINRSFDHLLFYGSRIETFKFVNHENEDNPVKIVLQQPHLDTKLNVIIEVHFIDFNEYEITVKTAMCTDSFSIFEGQFILEMPEQYLSILKRKVQNRIITIFTCQI